MILIADSGSTKTDWRLIDEEGNIHQAQTIGLNPYFVSDERIAEVLRTGALRLFDEHQIQEVFFYGSGLGTTANRIRVETLLSKKYPKAQLHIEHDLLGACRALCGRHPGIVVILGTGMNTAVYDGNEVVQQVKSLGYLLGDEGSGAEIGKKWIAAYLNGRAPAALAEAFREEYAVDYEQVLEQVYRQEQPNRYLAGFVPFLYKHREHPFIAELLHESFHALFDHYLSRYPQLDHYPVHFCGSIAYFFRAHLEAIAEDRDVFVGQFIQAPIAALTLYHLEQ